MKMFLVPYLVSAFAIFNISEDINPGDVPAVVVKSLETKFTDVTDLEWEKKKNLYEADFEIKNVDYTAIFDAKGKLVKYKKDITQSEVPEAIRSKISKDYPDDTIDDTEKLFIGTKKYYQVELDGKLLDKKLVYSEDGKEESIGYLH